MGTVSNILSVVKEGRMEKIMKRLLCKLLGHRYHFGSLAPAFEKEVYVCRRCGEADWRNWGK